MERITSLKDIKMNTQTGVALGNFDGIHIGHQALIVNLVEICKKHQLKSVVYTFSSHPKKLTSQKGAPKKIITYEKKMKLLAQLGVDYVVCVEFDEYQMTLSPKDFIQEILKNKLNMAYGIIGFNYHFGYKAQGDANFLESLKQKYKYDLLIVDAVKIQNEIISSTKIREYLKKGQIERANLFLGRPYCVTGKVVGGKRNGTQFGFPTANLCIKDPVLLPKEGVYLTKSLINGKLFESITNVGSNPTIGQNPITVETHLLNQNQDLYGQTLTVMFYQRIRDQHTFENTDELVEQIGQDVKFAKNFFEL